MHRIASDVGSFVAAEAAALRATLGDILPDGSKGQDLVELVDEFGDCSGSGTRPPTARSRGVFADKVSVAGTHDTMRENQLRAQTRSRRFPRPLTPESEATLID